MVKTLSMGTDRRRRGRTVGSLVLLAVAAVVLPAAAAQEPDGGGVPAVPDLFSVRLEGQTIRVVGEALATAADPRSSYSFATLVSTPGAGDDRNLSGRAVGTTNHPGDLGGAALFTPDSPTSGTANFPLYSEAFFPAFEGVNQTSYSEKCALNVSNTEAEACRDQPGPYAFAAVSPELDSLRAVGLGQDSGLDPHEPGQEETYSRSEVFLRDDGAIVGEQVNIGRDLAVPGTPITVRSFVTRTEVVATLDGVDAAGECTAEITVAGETVDTNEELQGALAPFGAVSGITVTYIPPTEAEVEEMFGGTKEVSCTGARFVVRQPDAAATVEYVYGNTFATSSQPADRQALGGVGLEPFGPPEVPSPPSPAVGGASVGAGAGDLVGGPPAPAPDLGAGATDDVPAPPPTETAAPDLVPEEFDAVPIAAATAAAATLVSLGVWLLLGVTGSLARGYTRLRLPPFPD